MTTKKLTKLLALYLPYILLGLVATNFGEAWRLAEGKELGDKIMSMVGTLPLAFANPLPSLHPLDLLIGFFCGAGLRLAVYLRSKNAKKYRHGMEYGSARWGTPKDIEPFQAPKFADNIILTKTERLMMSNRPPDPKNARNKNVLVVGGSGSGKTRFWLKPNLLQCHSSYVVTDPKGTIVLECGQAMLKNGYKVKILNTINFKKSMHYNPFSYVHSEKDILKLVTTLMTNTKGEGSGGDPFWEKSERLLLTALIAYLHYEAPVEEQNFATLLEMLNTMQVLEDDEEYQNPVDLLFEDVDFKNRTISINHNLVYRVQEDGTCTNHVNSPKTKAGIRIIPMIDEVFDAFLEEYQYQKVIGFCTDEIDGYSGFVFCTGDGKVYLPNAINRTIRSICADYNKEEESKAKEENRDPVLLPKFSCHILRHTFCTRFCENETNLKVIQEIMGHADISTTMDVYAEATQEKKKESMTSLQSALLVR